MGGSAAVSNGIESTLKNQFGEDAVSRIAGENRYETALKVYEEGGTGWSGTAIVATGENFPDALSISGYAFANKAPFFLTDSAMGMDEGTFSALENGGFANAVIVGGTEAVSTADESTLTKLFGEAGVERLQGGNRYETSTAVANFVIANGGSTDGSCLATGRNFPDALAGGVLAGKTGRVMLLADDTNTSTIDVLKAHAGDTFQLYYLGGTNALSKDVRDAAEAAIGMK